MGRVILNKKLIDIFSLRNKKIKKLQKENNYLKTLNSSFKKKNYEITWKFRNLWKKSKILNNDNKLLSKKNIELLNENEEYKNKIILLKKEINTINKKKKYYSNDFINFQEFLSKSYIYPITTAPFVHEDKRVFAFMDHLGKQLRKNVSNSDYNPLISIIMVTNNHVNILKKVINSVLNQTYSNFELIIINNDGEIVNNLLKLITDERIKILQTTENSYTYNLGLKIAKGEIVMYLNPPNEWDSEYIKTMIGAFIELPHADALYSGSYLYENFNSKPYGIQFATYNKPLLHNHNFIDLNCFCHKRDILNKIEGFDENLFLLKEWDFILKISNNFKMYSVPIILSKHYNYDFKDENSKSHLNYLETAKKILNKNKIPPKKYSPLNKKISIVIPNYDSLDQIKMCLNSIFSNESEEMIDIIVVDNNSRDNVKNFLIKLEKKGKIQLILNKINYGFTYAVNQGINISKKDSDILILNNDAVLTPGSIEHMQNYAYTLPKCGLIVPHEMLFEGTESISANVPFADNNFECDITPSKIHQNIINIPLFHDGETLELNFAPFFCTYIKREIYEKTLGLDYELGRHYRSDRIFSDFIRHYLNLKIYQAPHAFVYHRHQVATGRLKELNKEEYDYIYAKNQWDSKLANQLCLKKAEWED